MTFWTLLSYLDSQFQSLFLQPTLTTAHSLSLPYPHTTILLFCLYASVLSVSCCSQGCKLAAYNISDSASLFGLSVPISLSLTYVNYGSLTVTTMPPYKDLIILLVCFCSECFLLPSRQQVSKEDVKTQTACIQRYWAYN